MSSTSNAQDLLVNVFRPTYRWDSNAGFVPSLVVSNVTEVITGNLKADKLVVSDSNLNTYIGCNAGVNASNTASNVALGYSAMGGSLASSNNVAIGMFSLDGLRNSDSNVALGAGTDINGRGLRNVLIGPNVTMGDGSGNILIGTDISAGNVTNRFQLGRLLYADLCSGLLGVNTTNPTTAFDVSGVTIFRDKVGVQMVPTYSLDVNGSISATERYFGSNGTSNAPLYTFVFCPSSGLYVPTDASYGVGAVGVTIGGRNRFVVASNKSYLYTGLDICGTITSSGGSASFLAERGRSNMPAYAFSADASLGFYSTTDASGAAIGIAVGGVQRLVVGSNKLTMFGNLDVCGALSAVSGGGGGGSGGGGTVASNGTASAPSFTFSNDLSTGLHLVKSSTLAFDTSGVQRMCISSGFVGIATPTPLFPLDVCGTLNVQNGNGSGTLYVGGSSTGVFLNRDTGGNGYLRAGGTGVNLYLGTSNTNTMAILSTGLVGVGTLTPGYTLEVNGTTATSNALVPGYLRNALIPTSLDISGGNISNSGTTTSTNALVSGYLRNALIPTQFDISGGNISNSALTRSSNFRGSNGTASVPTYAFASDTGTGMYLDSAGTLGFATGGTSRITLTSGTLTATTGISSPNFNSAGSFPQITLGGPGYSNAIAFGGPYPGYYMYVGNQVGGAPNGQFAVSVDNNGSTAFSVATSGIIVPGHIRNALIPTQFDISGGNISNSALTRSSNFRAANGNATVPAYSFTSDTTSGLFSGGSGILGFAASGSQCLTVTAGGAVSTTLPLTVGTDGPSQIRITGGTSSSNNSIRFDAGGFLNYIGIGNSVGGAPDGQFAVSTDAGATASFRVATSGIIVPGHIRNALTPTQFDISGGNISNSNSIQTGNPADKNLYATMEIGKGYLYDLTGTAGTPAMAFQYVNGGYRHFIRSRHLNNPGNGNGIDFFLNTNGTSTGSTAPGTGNVLSMSVTATGVGIAKTTPDFPLDVSGTMNVQNGNGSGSLYVGGSSTGVVIQRDTTGHGYVRPLGAGVNLYLGTGSCNTMTILSTGLVGVGTVAPSYAMDVCGGAGTPSLNLATWPRIPLSNAVLAKGVANTNTTVGNTLNINTVVRTINPALATFTASNATSGGSLLINKAGIWSIMLVGSTGNGTQLWMDASTNNHSNIGVYTNGNPVLSVAYTPGSGTSNNTTCTFMGFLPSNVYVKPRLNGSLGGDADIVWRFNAIFHAETDAVTTWPF